MVLSAIFNVLVRSSSKSRSDDHGNIVLTWQSTPGRIYQLSATTNLDGVGKPILATNAFSTVITSITKSVKFFRWLGSKNVE